MVFTICTFTLTSEEIVRPGEGLKGLHLQIDIATTAVVNYIIWFLHSPLLSTTDTVVIVVQPKPACRIKEF